MEIKTSERNAIFPIMVQRKNPETGRWLNVSAQAKMVDADIIKSGIGSRGFEARIVLKGERRDDQGNVFFSLDH